MDEFWTFMICILFVCLMSLAFAYEMKEVIVCPIYEQGFCLTEEELGKAHRGDSNGT